MTQRALIQLATYSAMLLFAEGVGAEDQAQTTDAVLRAKFAPMELLLCFQGKSSHLPHDAGVVREAFNRIPALREGHTIVAGNSSGSIPAVYFSSFGFSEATIQHAELKLNHGNREPVRIMEDVNRKASLMIRGKPTEFPHSSLREYIAFALGVEHWQDAATIEEIVRRSTARPVFPCLIAACNKEVLEDRHPENRMAAGRLKEFDLSNLQVSWKPEVFEYYRQHPDQFHADHPHLGLGSDRRIGHSTTYFVDQSLFDLLSRIPPDERTADLRLMKDASDLALAIVASISEPTYFDPVVDPHPERILTTGLQGDLGCSRTRSYYGGYLNPLPAQDVRRMLPGLRVFGTGRIHITLPGQLLLKNWLLADCEEVALQSEWWADMVINLDQEFTCQMTRDVTGEAEAAFGRRRTRESLDLDQSLPAFVRPPHYNYPAAAAIASDKPHTDIYTDQKAPNGQSILKTMRGMGPLLSPQSSPR